MPSLGSGGEASIAILALAGITQASFAWPMRYFRGWRWEHVWVGQALTANLIFPIAFLALNWPKLRDAFAGVSFGQWAALFLFGVLWGIGGIGYGISLTSLGLSFTYSLVFGITTLAGALLPLFWPGLSHPRDPILFVAGLTLCIAGSIAFSRAGERRQRERQLLHAQTLDLVMPVPRLSFSAALIIAIFAGLFSASMGLALSFNDDLVKGAMRLGATPLIAPLVVWIPLSLGAGFIALAYGMGCGLRFHSIPFFWRKFAARNWLLTAGMGILGFGGMLLYGLGASGRHHPSKGVAWGLYMCAFILMGNALGFFTGEWQNCSRRTRVLLGGGIGALLGAVVSLASCM